MDDKHQAEVFRLQSALVTASTPFCPEEQEIAEYFKGSLTEGDRMKLERHLADCRNCLARVGILERLDVSHTDLRIPGAALAAARQMGPKAPARWPRRVRGWATAAVLLIAVFTFTGRDRDHVAGPGTPSHSEAPAATDSLQLRRARTAAAALEVLAPAPGAEIAPGSLLRWSEVPGTLHYDLFILSHEGDVLRTERLTRAEWILDQPAIHASSDNLYFKVEALLADGRTVSSKHVAFRYVERQ